jgi:TonB-dependent SusC/RagA subfamily outer membrane receptor
MYLRRLSVLIFIILSCLSFGYISLHDEEEDNRRLKKIKSSLEHYNSIYPHQKVYLHLNKPSYKAGENIWFKAYVVSATDHRPDTLSTNLYMELINSSKEVIEMKRIRLFDGFGYGDFILRDTLPEGLYQLRSYTNWMRNFGDDYYFVFNFPFKNPYFKKYISRRQANINKRIIRDDIKKSEYFDIQFLPEGGHLVENMDCVVGFKAINALGRSVKVRGDVYDSDKNKIVSFSSFHNGMGAFSIKPEKDKKYFALVSFNESREMKVDLPKSLERGIVMKTDNSNNDYILIDIKSNRFRTNDRTANEFALIGQVRGKIYHSSVINLADEHVQVRLEKRKFPTGIVHLTLFSYRYEAMGERLVFVNHDDNMIIKVNSEYINPGEKDSVRIIIDVLDAQGSPLRSNISLSVFEEEEVDPDSLYSSIRSNLLLTSDLRGYIENPKYYFQSKSGTESKALDYLMLTQGWRRFSWQEVINNELPEIKYPVENHITIGGQITGDLFKFPLKDCDVTLTILDEYNDQYYEKSDKKGYFQFDNLIYYDTVNLKIEARRPSKRKNLVIVLPEGSPEEVVRYYGNNELTTVSERDNKSYRRKRNIEIKEAMLEKEKEESERNLMTSIHGEPDYVITSDEIPSGYTDVLQVIKGRVPGVLVSGNSVLIRGPSTFYGSNEPLYLIDGVTVSGVSSVLAIPVEDIERIEILKGPSAAIYGSRGANGVIAIYTKRGMFMKKGIIDLQMLGYSAPREFYQPKYEVDDDSQVKILKSSAIYWAPEVRTGFSGQARISFHIPENTPKYRIIIEGISYEGHLGSTSILYE